MIIGNNKEVKKIYKDNEAIIGIKKGTLPIFSRGSIMESLLTLPAKITAVTKKIKDLKIYGNTSQEGTPTPDTPIPVNVVTGDNSITISNNDNTQSQTYPINLGSMELCKIGDYQDRIYKDNGKWYLNKQIGKVVLDGSESWETSGASVDKGVKAYRTSFNISNLKTDTDIISNRFVNNRVNWFIDLSAGKMINTANNLYIRISKTIAPDVETLKTWLSTHNTIVYYVLKEPTTTEITDTELINQLNAIELVNGDNYINSSSTYLQISQIFIKYRGE